MSPFESFQSTDPDLLEPGQRWSTYASLSPAQQGPDPLPPWVVISAQAVDTELGILKTGKEADVFLIERAVPGKPGCVMAAKRYRGPELSDFHRSAQYLEGRKVRDSRETRAMAKRTTFGRALSAHRWAIAEFEALSLLHSRGLCVPYPVQVDGGELLMEFIGDGAEAAPRLAQLQVDSLGFAGYFEQVVEFMSALAALGLAHGDLSAYNLLVHGGQVVAIDLPQLVDLALNPNGTQLLERDCRNICTWFTRKGVDCDAETLFSDLIARMFS